MNDTHRTWERRCTLTIIVGTILTSIVKEMDLGLIISASMKVSRQCRIAASEGNKMFGLIRRTIAQ